MTYRVAAAATVLLLSLGASLLSGQGGEAADVAHVALPAIAHDQLAERRVLRDAAAKLAAGKPRETVNLLGDHLDAPVHNETTAAARILAARAYHMLSEPWRRDTALRQVLSAQVSRDTRALAARDLGTFLYDEGRHEEAAALWERCEAEGLSLSLLHRLRLIWLYSADHDTRAEARRRFASVEPSAPGTAEERRLYGLIARRIYLRHITPESFGLLDGNVSAMAPDYDDLWIGTWTGGVARYTFSTGAAEVFQAGRETLAPTTVRSIVATGDSVWVGAYDGLFVFDKRRSTWREILRVDGRPLEKVQSVLVLDGKAYAATAGDGIWEHHAGAVRPILADSGIGPLVNVLHSSPVGVLVGTLDRGAYLVREGPAGRAVVRPLSEVAPGLGAVNVTCFVEDGAVTWVGTYGEGLYRWNRRTNDVAHFRKEDGSIPDDWILSGIATERAAYFGTFGGGVAVFEKRPKAWRSLGIAEGLSSADVASVSYWEPNLYFGTLGGGVTVFDERGYEKIP